MRDALSDGVRVARENTDNSFAKLVSESGVIIMPPLKGFAHATLLLVLLVIGCGLSAAQEKQGNTTSAPTGLSLEVNPKGGPPSYHSVPGSFFGGRLRRLPSTQPITEATQEWTTFMLRYKMESDAVRVKVYAWTEKFFEKETLIGDFLLHEGEKAAVDEMAKYGYEPMELTIVNVRPAPASLPSAASRIPSVEVVSVEAEQTNFPSYKITLRNISDKDITLLEVQSFIEGRLVSTHLPRGEHDLPLLKPGETFVECVSVGGHGLKQADDYLPSSPQIVEVITAVFNDKSYEGDRQTAAEFVAGQLAQKIQIVRALSLLQAVAETPGTSERAALDSLKKQVSALDRNAQQNTIDEILAEFPGLPSPSENKTIKIVIEIGLDQVRKELLKEISEYAQTLGRSPTSQPLSVWASGLRQKYEAWLSRL
jgi:hypothetical protein